MADITNLDEIVKKEARGLNDQDLGEVDEVQPYLIVTKKGVVDKDKFYLPKNLVDRFDGDKVWFTVSKEDAQTYTKDQTSPGNHLSFYSTIERFVIQYQQCCLLAMLPAQLWN